MPPARRPHTTVRRDGTTPVRSEAEEEAIRRRPRPQVVLVEAATQVEEEEPSLHQRFVDWVWEDTARGMLVTSVYLLFLWVVFTEIVRAVDNFFMGR